MSERIKWALQYFVSPVLAAVLAVAGNYYLVERPSLKKEYTKLGVDILLDRNAPSYMQKYAQELLQTNSPIAVSAIDKQKRLDELLHNIPANTSKPSNVTYGEALAQFAVLLQWVRDVQAVCPECISKSEFEKRFEQKLREIKELASSG